MARVRITGLVRLADRLRRDLARPISVQKRDQWRALVRSALNQIDQMLANQHASIRDLPAPSQHAYHFLNTLDWAKIATADAATDGETHPVAFAGLNAFLDRAANRLASAAIPAELDQIHASIATASRRLEFHIAQGSVTPERLSPSTRESRGWLAFLAERRNVALYAHALQAASLLIPLVSAQRDRKHVLLHFRPTPYLYKIRHSRLQNTLLMPTPMIAFDEAQFQLVADLIASRSRHAKQRLQEAMLSIGYQEIQAELESLAGLVEQARGAYHDLAQAFDRVNHRYFHGRMPKPRLTWSRAFTGRKFGHYDSIRDTVMVSSILDQANVPQFVVDYLLYHELLHKHLGVRVQDGRRYAHTPEFRALERRFGRHEEAESHLERLARLPNDRAIR